MICSWTIAAATNFFQVSLSFTLHDGHPSKVFHSALSSVLNLMDGAFAFCSVYKRLKLLTLSRLNQPDILNHHLLVISRLLRYACRSTWPLVSSYHCRPRRPPYTTPTRIYLPRPNSGTYHPDTGRTPDQVLWGQVRY